MRRENQTENAACSKEQPSKVRSEKEVEKVVVEKKTNEQMKNMERKGMRFARISF